MAEGSHAGAAGVRYSAAIFLGSGLLFLIEPIAAKRLLPLLGGGAAVWTACLVFFQCALLIGYGMAHLLVTRLSPRRQAAVYCTLIALSVFQLGYAIDPTLRASPERPVTSVVWLLTSVIGLPFLTLSATSPLLQAWFARETRGGSAYRLYAVSNVGSLLALLLYPLALEPFLSLREQSLTVAVGFIAFAAVAGVIVSKVWREVAAPVGTPVARMPSAPLPKRELLLWITMSACGSLLLSATTTYISQNIATIPLLWIAPLVAYLSSFVVAFSREQPLSREGIAAFGLLGIAAAGFVLSRGILGLPLVVVAIGFCFSLFLICLFLHAELYRRRPPEAQLTTFYFSLSAGGALGAIMVAVVAPTVLNGNYELAFGLMLAAALGAVTLWDEDEIIRGAAILAAVGAAWIMVRQVRADQVNSLKRVRNFYGTLHVTQVTDAYYKAPSRTLYNGAISHGRQVFREDIAHTPTTYYGRESGVGLAIDLCCESRARRIGVIGLGAGTMAAYGKPGDVIRFYDINPAVDDVAREQFTFLRASQATIEIVIGDARVSLANEPPQRYDVIAVDAFSGDAIPVHLITMEALEVYKRHLAPGGIVAFHVSNRHLDLRPVVAQLAQNAGMQAANVPNQGDRAKDVWSSDWMLVSDNTAFLRRLEIMKATTLFEWPRKLRLWTDDYNSLLPVFKFRR